MDRSVLITGASSGIGKEAALLFKARGWNVIATMRCPAGRKTGLEGSGIELLHLDVTDRESIRGAVRAALERFGSLDVLVNNAGYGMRGAFEASTAEEVRREFETNVFGLMEVTRELIPIFRARRSGLIVNVASIGGRAGFPFYSVYNASKWAVEGFSESLRYELEPFGIRVKVIEPGIIKTDFYERSLVSPTLEGEDVYAEHLRHSMESMASFEAHGSHPRVIAKLIYRAATDRSKRLRYHAGRGAGMILCGRKLLPDALFLRLIRAFSM